MSAREAMFKAARTAFERLPEPVRKDLVRRRGQRRMIRGISQIKANQALLALRLAELEKQQNGAPKSTPEVPDDRFPAGVRTRLCTQEQISQPWFEPWCKAVGYPPFAHRKLWEWAYIGQVLDTMGMLDPGRRGLGFGVGRERLVAAFAARDVDILATDVGAESQEALGWIRSDQHAASVEAMQWPDLCDPEQFRKRVTWRAVDMRDIPTDLGGFDFCWSACSLEHLGTLAAGWDFVEKSIGTLRPGGIAVHTTEFNLSSNDDTIEAGGTVVYRQRDVEELRDRLEAAGHEVAAIDLTRGTGLLDQYVDVPPYVEEEPVLRFLLGNYTMTSVAVVVRRGAA